MLELLAAKLCLLPPLTCIDFLHAVDSLSLFPEMLVILARHLVVQCPVRWATRDVRAKALGLAFQDPAAGAPCYWNDVVLIYSRSTVSQDSAELWILCVVLGAGAGAAKPSGSDVEEVSRALSNVVSDQDLIAAYMETL